MRSSSIGRFAWLVLPALAANLALAQQNPEQALVRAQALLRQVSAEKQQLEVENAKLQAEIASLDKELAAAEARLKETGLDLASRQRESSRLNDRLVLLQGRLERTEERLREAVDAYRNTSRELRQAQLDGTDLDSRLAETRAALDDSERKNLALYQANVELLKLYKKKGPLDALFQKEPVTGLKQVQIENIVQEYQFQLEDSLTDANRTRLDSTAADESASTP